ncbi:MAG TPA: Ni/Fe-hydrogenase cytochrome b subunit [Anaeromyxobacter sp.]|nr:Ni/Fe-hydrogenase cytochrome b subunit [Anaeromyxobacter sp.]
MIHAVERPLGGPVLTRSGLVLVALAGLAVAIVAVRLLAGLGPVSAMSDGYPWGIWKPLNVVTFTGVGAGALALALVTYVANRGRYHPLVRSAVLVGAITYTLAGASVVVDLGRWWVLWAIFVPPWWNLDSVLLEVALCVMAYCAVLWIEVFPAVLETWSAREGRLGAFADRLRPWIGRLFPFVVATAIVLPFMHQSSLGSLFLVSASKLHPLWHTPWLPALFLLSCLAMGAGGVIAVDTITALAWGRARDRSLDAALALVMAAFALAFAALRIADVAWAGELGAIRGTKGLLFLVELALLVYPAARVLQPSYRRNAGFVFWAALLTLAGGALYRFDTYLAAFDPATGWSYFPSVGEILFSLGLASVGAILYVAAVKRLPILSGAISPGPAPLRRRAA